MSDEQTEIEETEEVQAEPEDFVRTAQIILRGSAGQSYPDLELFKLWDQTDGTDWRVFFATNIDQSTRYLVEYVKGEHTITMVTDAPMPELVEEAKE